MKFTDKIKLQKPENGEFYSVEVFNTNSDLIDKAFKNFETDPTDVLEKLKTVDGSGSGLDADLLDGKDSTAFAAADHKHEMGDINNLKLTAENTAVKDTENNFESGTVEGALKELATKDKDLDKRIDTTETNLTNKIETVEADLKQSVSDGKKYVATCITDKGVTTSSSDSFKTMGDNVLSIKTQPDILEDMYGVANLRDTSSDFDIFGIEHVETYRKETTPSTLWRGTKHTKGINSVAVDNQGNVYSASNDGTLLKFNSSGSLIWTYTGNSSSVNCVAVDYVSNVYIACNNNTIHKIGSDGTLLWKFTGNIKENGFNSIKSLCLDNQGNVCCGGSYGNIYKLNSSNGNLIWNYVSDHKNDVLSICVDSYDNIYSIGSTERTIEKRATKGNLIEKYLLSSSWIYSLYVDIYANMYAGDSRGKVYKLDKSGNSIWVYEGQVDSSIDDICVDKEGNVYSVSASDANSAHKIDRYGKFVWKYTGHADNSVRAVCIDNEGNVYTGSSDNLNNEVHKIRQNYQTSSLTNADKTSFVWKGEGYISEVYSMTVDQYGNVYVGSYYTVYKINEYGKIIWQYSAESNKSIVDAVAVDNEGNVYVNIYRVLYKLDKNGNLIWERRDEDYTAITSSSMIFDKEGNMYVGCYDKTVRKLNKNGGTIWSVKEHGYMIDDIAVDYLGNVYSVASFGEPLNKIDRYGNLVWKYTGHGTEDSITDVAVDYLGNAYTCSYDNTVHKIDKNGKMVWKYALSYPNRINSLCVDYSGIVYIGGNKDDKQIRALNKTGGVIWTYLSETDTNDICVDDVGNVYIGKKDKTLSKISLNRKVETTAKMTVRKVF